MSVTTPRRTSSYLQPTASTRSKARAPTMPRMSPRGVSGNKPADDRHEVGHEADLVRSAVAATQQQKPASAAFRGNKESPGGGCTATATPRQEQVQQRTLTTLTPRKAMPSSKNLMSPREKRRQEVQEQSKIDRLAAERARWKRVLLSDCRTASTVRSLSRERENKASELAAQTERERRKNASRERRERSERRRDIHHKTGTKATSRSGDRAARTRVRESLQSESYDTASDYDCSTDASSIFPMITPTEAETDTDAGGGLQHGGLRLGLKVPKLWEKGATPTTTPKVTPRHSAREKSQEPSPHGKNSGRNSGRSSKGMDSNSGRSSGRALSDTRKEERKEKRKESDPLGEQQARAMWTASSNSTQGSVLAPLPEPKGEESQPKSRPSNTSQKVRTAIPSTYSNSMLQVQNFRGGIGSARTMMATPGGSNLSRVMVLKYMNNVAHGHRVHGTSASNPSLSVATGGAALNLNSIPPADPSFVAYIDRSDSDTPGSKSSSERVAQHRQWHNALQQRNSASSMQDIVEDAAERLEQLRDNHGGVMELPEIDSISSASELEGDHGTRRLGILSWERGSSKLVSTSCGQGNKVSAIGKEGSPSTFPDSSHPPPMGTSVGARDTQGIWTPSIRPDNLDYHALAREKLALQLLLREQQEEEMRQHLQTLRLSGADV